MDAERREGPPNRDPEPRKFRFGWFIIACCLGIFLLRALMPQTVGEQTRRRLEAALSEHYRDLQVEIGSGRFEPSVGMIFEKISFKQRHLGRAERPLVSIDRIIAETDFVWERIKTGEMPLTARRMLVSGLEVTAWIDQDGNWSLQELAPFPQLGPGCPLVIIRDARLRLVSDPAEPTHAVVLRDIDVRITKQSHEGEETVQVTAIGGGENVRRLELAVRSVGERQEWSGHAQNIRFDSDLIDRLPASIAQRLQPLSGLDVDADADFKGHFLAREVANWQARFTLHDGRFQYPDLPMPIEQLRGVVHLGPEGMSVEAAQGAVGDAICRVTGKTSGIAWPCDLDFHVWADSLRLDERLAHALPDPIRDVWDRFLPFGHINLDAHLQYQDQQWKSEAVVQCQGVDIQYDKFPYPVRQIIGTIHLQDQVAWSERLRGTVDGRAMQCAFRTAPPESGLPRWMEMTTEGPIAFDETLLKSLSPRGESTSGLERFVRSLAPEGGLHLVKGRFEAGADGRVQRTMDLRVSDGRLRYQRFPYPLYDLQGRIEVEGDQVRLVGFEARNGGEATVRCAGVWLAVPDGGLLDLSFHGEHIPLDQSLRLALPSSAQQTWDAFAPSGMLQRVDVSLKSTPQQPAPKLTIVAQQLGKDTEPRTTASLRPTALPYRLDIVDGKVSFDGEQVLIDRLDGRHEGSRLIATGTCAKSLDGRWLLDLDVLSGSRLRPDTDLFAALPVQVRGAFQRLQLRGPVNIRGQTRMRLPNETITVPESEWDLQLQLEGNRIGDVGPVHDLRGELSVRGSQNDEGVRADGVVHIDSLHYNDLQLTGISGPFSVRGEKLQIGGLQRDLDGKRVLQLIRGKAFGGELGLSGELSLSTGEFGVNAVVANLVVPQLLADLKQPQSNLTGLIDGQVELEGTLGATHLLKGVGSATLGDANLYQLPQIVQLLTQLRIEPDEEVAFTDGTAEFTISGDQITFSQLQLWGDLVALHGSGTVSRLRELDLVFNTRVSPQNTWSRLIRPLGSQRYTLWTLSVRGPVDAPTIERNALDGVSETLERLFPGMGRAAESTDHRLRPGFR